MPVISSPFFYKKKAKTFAEFMISEKDILRNVPGGVVFFSFFQELNFC